MCFKVVCCRFVVVVVVGMTEPMDNESRVMQNKNTNSNYDVKRNLKHGNRETSETPQWPVVLICYIMYEFRGLKTNLLHHVAN